jgi:hypothetical protein
MWHKACASQPVELAIEMAVRLITLQELSDTDLIPQAVIGKPVLFFEQHLGLQFIDGFDDLDYYRGAAFYLDDELSFALMHHRGDPPDTTTLYLPREIRDLQEISRAVEAIVKEMRIPRDSIAWQRSDNPNL